MLKLDFDERDLRSLRVFCHVAEAGGFTAAQGTLFMSKASIGRHIREVEERLGVRLCERGPAGFRLTAEGEVAVKLAKTALRALGQIRPEIDAVHGTLSGQLVIGIGENTLLHPACRLPQALRILRQQAPQVRPEILVMPFSELGAALHSQRIDLAIRGKYGEDHDFKYVPLYIEEHRFYAVESLHNSQNVVKLPLVYRAHPYVDHALATKPYLRGPEVIGLDAVAALVATGLYVGLLPAYYGDMLKSQFGVCSVDKDTHYIHFGCAVTLASRQTNRKVELFLGILRGLHEESLKIEMARLEHPLTKE